MSSRLRNCPTPFYINCKNASNFCNGCAAGRGRANNTVCYLPIEDIGEHPFRISREKQEIQKQAVKTERNVIRSIAKATARSGAKYHDGDAEIMGLRCEIKNRGVARASFNLTLKEYDKGQRQGINIFAINIIRADNQKKELIYMLDEHTLAALLAKANIELEH